MLLGGIEAKAWYQIKTGVFHLRARYADRDGLDQIFDYIPVNMSATWPEKKMPSLKMQAWHGVYRESSGKIDKRNYTRPLIIYDKCYGTRILTNGLARLNYLATFESVIYAELNVNRLRWGAMIRVVRHQNETRRVDWIGYHMDGRYE